MDRLIDENRRVPDHAFARVDLARVIARVIGTLPPARWLAVASDLAERIDLPQSVTYEEIFEAGRQWTEDPAGCVVRELASLRPSAPAPTRRRPVMSGRNPPAMTLASTLRSSPKIIPQTSDWRFAQRL